MSDDDREAPGSDRLRRTPMTWPELQSIILSPNLDDLSKLARSEEQQITYRKCRANIKNEWESIYDYLLCTKFDFDWEWVEVEVGGSGPVDAPSQSSIQRKRRSKPTFQEYQNELRRNLNNDKGKHESKQLRICMNDFPYYFAPGIQHWVLWKLGGDVTSDEILQAKKCIFRDDYQLKHIIHNDIIVNSTEVFLHWVNPPHLKSLPGIDHVHILFRVQN